MNHDDQKRGDERQDGGKHERHDDEEQLLRSVALQNAQSIGLARQRADQELIRATEALQRQSEWLRVTLASIGDAVITTDAAGNVSSLNPVAESLTGWSQAEAQGKPLGEVFRIVNEESRQPVESPAVQALRQGRTVGLANHTLLIAKDGTERAIDDSAAPIQDGHGNILGVVLIFRDITERREDEARLRQSESQLQVVMDHAPVFIVRCNKDARFQFANRGYAERFGLRPDELIGKSIAEVIGPEAFAAIRPYVETVLTGQGVEYELEVPYQHLGRRYMRCAYEPERDNAGRVQGFVAVIQDITERKQAEGTKALLGTIVEWSQDVIVSKNLEGRILTWNPAAEQLFGYTAREAIGQSIKLIIPPERQDEEDIILGRLKLGERIGHFETVRQAKDGRRIDVSLSVSPLRDSQGRIVGASKIARDITTRKRTEQTSRFLADASAALAELTDYESTLQKVAALAVPFFADWCAVDMHEADGTVRRLAVAHADPAKARLARELDRKYPSRPSDSRGLQHVLRTGSPEWLPTISDETLIALGQNDDHWRMIREPGLKSYLCVPLKSRGRVLGAITFVTAESGRTFSADDLRAAEDLAQRAVIAIENANLLATLKESDQRKDEFLAMLAHELRNPLAPVRNALQIFGAKAPPLPELVWAREVIDRQIAQMTRLVDDLLDVSRITRGKIDLRKEIIPLATVMETAIEASRPLIERGGHRLQVSLPPEPLYVNADVTRLSQVLLNLLNNAAKYTDDGGCIEFAAEPQGDRVVIRVKDTGVGISAEMLPRIFDVFVQVDRSLERSQGGLGIGLTLVQKLVSLHGGAVEARSEGPGKGSEFRVTLPLVAEETGSRGQPGEGPPIDRVTRRILVVDDNKDAADSLAMLLRLSGNEVVTAYDGLEAVETTASFQPHVVLLDIGLPRLNGYEAARRIRERVGDGVKLIALTGWGQENDRRQSQEAGFDDHLTKPVEFTALQTLLATSKEEIGRGETDR